MNNFIFQNSTKVYFGKGCVKEYLACLTKNANTIFDRIFIIRSGKPAFRPWCGTTAAG